MPMLDLQDVSLYYELDGPSGQPVLLLSNSLGANLDMWSEQLEAFANHFQVLRYDTRGQGKSSMPAGPYSIDQMGKDVLALLDALNLDRVHFCGISMGGLIGQWLGIHAPHRLLKLVLSNTAAKIGNEVNWNQRIVTIQQDGFEPIVSTVLSGWFSEPFHRNHPEVIAKMEDVLFANSREGYAASSAAVRDADLRGAIQLISTPTLVVYSTEDCSTTPGEAMFLSAHIKGSQSLALQAAHISNIEAASEFSAGVLRFLAETGT
jgi:3-oxoadipate enol-lactonase